MNISEYLWIPVNTCGDQWGEPMEMPGIPNNFQYITKFEEPKNELKNQIWQLWFSLILNLMYWKDGTLLRCHYYERYSKCLKLDFTYSSQCILNCISTNFTLRKLLHNCLEPNIWLATTVKLMDPILMFILETYDEGSGIAIEDVPPCPRNSKPVRYYWKWMFYTLN